MTGRTLYLYAAVMVFLFVAWQALTWIQTGNQPLQTSSEDVSGLSGFSDEPSFISVETVTDRRQGGNGFTWKSGYDIWVKDSILFVSVAINLVPAKGVTRLELTKSKQVWKMGIERIWSNRFALQTATGKGYPIVVTVLFKSPRYHHDVIVRPGSGRTDELNWNIGDSQELVGHEFAHMLGLYDEYQGGALAPQNAVIDDSSILSSNPGENVATSARHYEPFSRWFMGKTMMKNVRIIEQHEDYS